jgi:hypothetical protein
LLYESIQYSRPESLICDISMAWLLFDFTNERGDSVLTQWVRAEKLSRRDVGQLNQKLDMLKTAGPDLPPKLLAGPVYKQIYKLKIYGERMLRPFLCKGPFEMDAEYTLLLGAIEANGELDHEPQEADKNRDILLTNRKRRCDHERY